MKQRAQQSIGLIKATKLS